MICDCHRRLGPNPDSEFEKEIWRGQAEQLNQIVARAKVLLAKEKPVGILRCKMKVNEVWISKNADGVVSSERVKLSAVYGNTEENKDWAKWTPSASFEIYINNPTAMDKLAKGHEFFVDFTPAKSDAQ
jgi:hypothetical protein